jgi:hypothetical protein
VRRRITRERLRELVPQAAVNVVRDRRSGHTVSEATVDELRRLVLRELAAV